MTGPPQLFSFVRKTCVEIPPWSDVCQGHLNGRLYLLIESYIRIRDLK